MAIELSDADLAEIAKVVLAHTVTDEDPGDFDSMTNALYRAGIVAGIERAALECDVIVRSGLSAGAAARAARALLSSD